MIYLISLLPLPVVTESVCKPYSNNWNEKSEALFADPVPESVYFHFTLYWKIMGDLTVTIWDPRQAALFTEHEISYKMSGGTSKMAADESKQNTAFIMKVLRKFNTEKIF